MARPITMEKPLKAKEPSLLRNNGASKPSPDHSPAVNSANHDERKISSTKSYTGHDHERNHSAAAARHHSASAAEKRTALDKLLNSADVATDVDTGQPVFVHNEERHRNKQALRNTR